LEWAAPDAAAPVDPDAVYSHMALGAPYLEVIEEMTLTEFLTFHQDFKPWIPGMDVPGIIDIIGLGGSRHKQIQNFSSGMKQRVRLAQALFSNTPVLLLDEPCTNFDQAGYELYRRLIAVYAEGRTVIVSSNDPQEYDFCRELLLMESFKGVIP
jgi:ABC-type multidrug transport system ATPase subunit